jgi:pectate lyase
MAGAQACTLTDGDYSPALVPTTGSSITSSRSGNSGVEPLAPPPSESATSADTSDGPAVNGVTEAPSAGSLIGNEQAVDGVADVDAGAPAGDAESSAAALPELIGWAGVAGLGLATTTGGGTSAPILVQTAEELVEFARRPEPLTLAIAGTLDVGSIELASDKTLFGTSVEATLRGAIGIGGTAESFARNVIVHNLRIDAASAVPRGDGIQIAFAHHVWIDHCEIRDAAGGLIDIVHGSDFVTVSHTRFLYTDAAPDPAHRFAAIVGHDATNAAEDQGHLRVTWHHNLWGENVSRALIGRFGRLHLFNNLAASPGNETVVEADVSAQVLLENNWFVGVASPHVILPGSGASLEASGNVYVETTGPRDAAGTAAAPPYDYPLATPVAALITGEAGPR